MTDRQAPTPHPGINALLTELLSAVRGLLGGGFTGLYLHGSLALGGFHPATSDIDFLMVTEGPPGPDDVHTLAGMHARLQTGPSPWARRLEGPYLPRAELRRHRLDAPRVPWLGTDGHFALERLGSDWILQRWILQTHGLRLAGPPLRRMIEPLHPGELRASVRGSLAEWWSPPFPSPGRFESGGYRVYAVLTMCRSLYLLERGRPASKLTAAAWARIRLGESWSGLIQRATDWRPGRDFDPFPGVFALIPLTLEGWGLPAPGP